MLYTWIWLHILLILIVRIYCQSNYMYVWYAYMYILFFSYIYIYVYIYIYYTHITLYHIIIYILYIYIFYRSETNTLYYLYLEWDVVTPAKIPSKALSGPTESCVKQLRSERWHRLCLGVKFSAYGGGLWPLRPELTNRKPLAVVTSLAKNTSKVFCIGTFWTKSYEYRAPSGTHVKFICAAVETPFLRKGHRHNLERSHR